jgi:ribonuclease P protein component
MLAKQFRFHGYGSLKFLYNKGKIVRARYVSLKYISNPRREDSRLAVVVAKKVSKKAPVRNRIRRRLYEAVRLHWPMLKPGQDMIITVFDENIANIPSTDLNKIIVELLTKADLYK